MKKIIGMILTIIVCLAISAPAFASYNPLPQESPVPESPAPTTLVPITPAPPMPPAPTPHLPPEPAYDDTGLEKISGNELGNVVGNRVFCDTGNITVTDLKITAGSTLKTYPITTITVTGKFDNQGSIDLYGTLIVSGQTVSSGIISLKHSSSGYGKLIGPSADCGAHKCEDEGTPTFNNGICAECGFINKAFHVHSFADGVCICGEKEPVDEAELTDEAESTVEAETTGEIDSTEESEPADEASILSEGNIWIIIAVAAVVLGGVVTLVVLKRRRRNPKSQAKPRTKA